MSIGQIPPALPPDLNSSHEPIIGSNQQSTHLSAPNPLHSTLSTKYSRPDTLQALRFRPMFLVLHNSPPTRHECPTPSSHRPPFTLTYTSSRSASTDARPVVTRLQCLCSSSTAPYRDSTSLEETALIPLNCAKQSQGTSTRQSELIRGNGDVTTFLRGWAVLCWMKDPR